MANTCPCRNCKVERVPDKRCHTTCEAYIAFKQKSEVITQERIKAYDIRDYVFDSVATVKERAGIK